MQECEINPCVKQEYESELQPQPIPSQQFIQEYDSLDDINNPLPYTIYVVNGTSYYYEDNQFVEIEGGSTTQIMVPNWSYADITVNQGNVIEVNEFVYRSSTDLIKVRIQNTIMDTDFTYICSILRFITTTNQGVMLFKVLSYVFKITDYSSIELVTLSSFTVTSLQSVTIKNGVTLPIALPTATTGATCKVTLNGEEIYILGFYNSEISNFFNVSSGQTSKFRYGKIVNGYFYDSTRSYSTFFVFGQVINQSQSISSGNRIATLTLNSGVLSSKYAESNYE